tara:strand:- start:958 stop:1218 length:261 start_codon:yes stop_codon:yes gene_type:complete
MSKFRLVSVKHAEFEIYKGMLLNERAETIGTTMQSIFDRVVPKKDPVALKRWNTAIENVRLQMVNKMESRKPYLPSGHIDDVEVTV